MSAPDLPSSFESPRAGRPDLLILAGEHSGDQHAARVVQKLRANKPALRIAALGGPELEKAGAQLLHDMTGFSAVGFVEGLANYGYYKTLFDRTLAWIRAHRPRAICLVDYPGFNLRLADTLKREKLSKAGGGEIAVYFYISPQIWAWKSGRRFKMAETLDSLGVIFPFELDCYKDTRLPVKFVGHPFVTEDHRAPVVYDRTAPVLLLPGSRPKPVRKIFPVLLQAWAVYRETHPEARAIVIHPGEPVRGLLHEIMAEWPAEARGVDLVAGTCKEPLRACATLTSSGTMSLSVALAGIPGAVFYRVNPISWAIGKYFIGDKIRFLGIANILLGRPAWPEFLQGDADPEKLAARLAACTADPAVIEAAQHDAAELHRLLGGDPAATGALTPESWLAEALA
jgi:lipid-A-disaccharide synthase